MRNVPRRFHLPSLATSDCHIEVRRVCLGCRITMSHLRSPGPDTREDMRTMRGTWDRGHSITNRHDHHRAREFQHTGQFHNVAKPSINPCQCKDKNGRLSKTIKKHSDNLLIK
ncbi:uncharacterized protein LOC105430450 [Pogonomyrmex barbatus]|uniref:Uncharacterized protein LOC105430450 n=1 Tax=Pogonomyrmex barbatus TaxID=144034 RepID=A0A6I9WRQ6_9HYME|nr:uncharacterized protein LOC105430450 [Pogonomyrmex barbatus]